MSKKSKMVYDESTEDFIPVPQHQKTTIISKFSFKNYRSKRSTNVGKSLLIPDRTLTLRQIAERFANGLQVMDEKVALYDREGEHVIKGFEQLDLTERMEIIKNTENAVREAKAAQRKALHDKELKTFSDKVQEAVNAELKKREEAVQALTKNI